MAARNTRATITRTWPTREADPPFRSEAKRAAIEGLERDHLASGFMAAEIDEVGAQNGAQSDVPDKPMLN
jgi:hypothetical protein